MEDPRKETVATNLLEKTTVQNQLQNLSLIVTITEPISLLQICLKNMFETSRALEQLEY